MTLRQKYAIVTALDALEEALRSIRAKCNNHELQDGSPLARWHQQLEAARLATKHWDEQP